MMLLIIGNNILLWWATDWNTVERVHHTGSKTHLHRNNLFWDFGYEY